jgi:DNA (cytosine-5)-methyltransferase 1
VDFFCGAGGMSYGLAKSGIKVLAGIDLDVSCRKTYERNNRGTKFIHEDVASLSTKALCRKLRISRYDDRLIFAACSPCQFWSKVNTDKRKSRSSAFLLEEFLRFINWIRPGFVVVENVPGLLSKKRLSLLPQFKKFLRARKYAFAHAVVNSNDYGVPQNRRRYLLIATRLTQRVDLPPTTKKRFVVRDFLGRNNGFSTIEAGHQDSTQFLHTAASLSTENLKRIRRTPVNGGTRQSWRSDPKLQIPAYKQKDEIFRDVYARMFWDRPAPTITTRFNSFSNGRFGHPEEHRAISLREGATLQTFPKRYIFAGTNQGAIARQIGNAVPPALAKRIGHHLLRMKKMASSSRCPSKKPRRT